MSAGPHVIHPDAVYMLGQVVALSATDREEEAAARALGADAFLAKPVDPEALLDAVRCYG
jgi:CheY-like chemotaxis protein